eukprot:TRINITY_DN20741_c0_g1_i1.p2 TRINITY_DN20741_c0_g1~~TRINITY_DN20741_c0_g1_i1.p2  ORF type:complete len:186 (+),score=23.00 TRINITY_DN20741_c0_g1_i1:28-558(+)
MPRKQETQGFSNEWKVGMFEAPFEEPLTCLCSCLCAPCKSYQQRMALIETPDNYHCCGGIFGQKLTGCCDPCTNPCPHACLCLEVCVCTGWSVSGNRWLLQSRFGLQNTYCDNCLLWTTCIISWTLTILRCAGVDLPDELELCVDCLFLSVVGCMQTQHSIEMEKQGVKPSSYAMF